jgi:hypothetical protein
MADRLPDGLTLKRNRDLQGRGGHVWYRRALLCLIAVLPVLALLNVFGQSPTTTSAHALAAELAVTAPARLRSGLIFQVRIQVTAHQNLAKPQLVFDRGWWNSMSENSVEPNPSSQTNLDGQIVFSYPRLTAGHTLTEWLYFQVNPTNVGERPEDITLDNGSTTIARVHRSLTIFP